MLYETIAGYKNIEQRDHMSLGQRQGEGEVGSNKNGI